VPFPEPSESEDDRDAGRGDHEIADRQARADMREAALNVWEVRIEAREAATADRQDAANRILAEAGVRDDQAEVRDAIAEKRKRVASLDAFLQDNDRYDAAHVARRAAALDRFDAQTDRTSSADDRSKLAEENPAIPRGDRRDGPSQGDDARTTFDPIEQ